MATADASGKLRLLILGGTTEASRLVSALAAAPDVEQILSLAGRTAHPVLPPVRVRIGGFGGAGGLAGFLRDERIAAVVDATHPFASRMSENAWSACGMAGVPLRRFSRPPWIPEPGDDWKAVPDIPTAIALIGSAPCRAFLTTGRLGLAASKAAPQHHYLLRSIDPPETGDLPPDHRLVLARGPFAPADEEALMRGERIDTLVTKNSGGAAGAAKLAAARQLGIRIIMVDRPAGADSPECHSLESILAWIDDQRARP